MSLSEREVLIRSRWALRWDSPFPVPNPALAHHLCAAVHTRVRMYSEQELEVRRGFWRTLCTVLRQTSPSLSHLRDAKEAPPTPSSSSSSTSSHTLIDVTLYSRAQRWSFSAALSGFCCSELFKTQKSLAALNPDSRKKKKLLLSLSLYGSNKTRFSIIWLGAWSCKVQFSVLWW